MYIEIWKPVERGQAGIAKSQQVKINAEKRQSRNVVKTQPMLVGSIGPMRYDSDSGLSTFEPVSYTHLTLPTNREV